MDLSGRRLGRRLGPRQARGHHTDVISTLSRSVCFRRWDHTEQAFRQVHHKPERGRSPRTAPHQPGPSSVNLHPHRPAGGLLFPWQSWSFLCRTSDGPCAGEQAPDGKGQHRLSRPCGLCPNPAPSSGPADSGVLGSQVLDEWVNEACGRALPTLTFKGPAMGLCFSGEGQDSGDKARSRPWPCPLPQAGHREQKGFPVLGPRSHPPRLLAAAITQRPPASQSPPTPGLPCSQGRAWEAGGPTPSSHGGEAV